MTRFLILTKILSMAKELVNPKESGVTALNEDKKNFIADACLLMERGASHEEVLVLVDAACGLIYAAKEAEKETVTL